jgi:peptidoglycan/LPS O-acetylase OafA/YrhL
MDTSVVSLNSTAIKKRISYLDLLKFIAMSFICFAHVLQRYYYPNFAHTIGFSILYSVELSIFFFVGGYLVKRPKTLKELLLYLLKMIVTYLGPAYLFTYLSIWLLPQFTEQSFSYWMGVLFWGTDTFYWYFLVAFFINGILALGYYLSQLFLKKEGLKWDLFRVFIVALICGASWYGFSCIYNAPNLGPKCLSSDLTLYYMPIAFVGFLFAIFKPYFLKLKKVSLITWITFGLCLVGYIVSLLFYSDWLTGLSGSFLDIFYHVLGSLAGTVVYFILAYYLSKIGWIAKLSSLGRLSGPFYLVHVFFIRLIRSYVSRPTSLDGGMTIFVISFMFIFYFASLLLTWVLVKMPLTDLLLFFDYRRGKELLALGKNDTKTGKK